MNLAGGYDQNDTSQPVCVTDEKRLPNIILPKIKFVCFIC